MPTPIFICGAECGLATTGTAPPAGTVRHWAAVAGAPTVVTSGPTPMLSDRCYRFNPTAATSVMSHTYATAIASPSVTVGRFDLYIATMPAGVVQIVETQGTTAQGAVYLDGINSRIIGGRTGVTGSGFQAPVTTGVWYRVEFRHTNGATFAADTQVDGVSTTQYSVASAASASTSFTIGVLTADTCNIYIDNLTISGTSGDYPIGAGVVAGLYPAADGAHNYSANTDFLDGGTAQALLQATAANEHDTFLSLRSKIDGGLSTTIDNANFVTDSAGLTTEYLRWYFENVPGDAASINGVASVSTHHAATATANAQTMKLIDVSAAPAPEMNVLGTWSGTPANTAATGVDLSETTIVTVYKCAATAVTTGAWTVANVNDLGVQWGATDVSPAAYIDGICLEVDYVQSAPVGPITHDRSTEGGFVITPVSSLPFAHQIGAGTDRLLVVAACIESATATPRVVSGVTYNGVAMTLAIAGEAGTRGLETNQRAELWYMLDADLPAAGSYNVVITLDAALAASEDLFGAATSVFGASQTAPEATATSGTLVDASTFSTNITTLTKGAWVFDVIGGGNQGTWTANAGQIWRSDMQPGTASHAVATSTKYVAVAGSTTMGWTASEIQSRFAQSLAVWAPSAKSLIVPPPRIRRALVRN